MLRRKPRAEESFDAGRSSIARWRTSVSTINLRLLHWHGQSTQRSRPGNGRRYLEFRLSITFDWFRYSPRVVKRSASQVAKSGPSRRSAALPQFVTPQLSQPVGKPPSGAQWLHEIKLDGYRMAAGIGNRG